MREVRGRRGSQASARRTGGSASTVAPDGANPIVAPGPDVTPKPADGPPPVKPPEGPPAVETDVHVLLSGPYAFSVLDESGHVISGLYSSHDLRVAPKQVLRLQAKAVFLDQRVTIDEKPGGTVRLQAPATGKLLVRATRETCTFFLNNFELGFPPIADQRVAAGKYRLTQRCPDGESTEMVTIRPGKTEMKLFP